MEKLIKEIKTIAPEAVVRVENGILVVDLPVSYRGGYKSETVGYQASVVATKHGIMRTRVSV